MRVGDRHPKQNFETVIIGGRQYQTASMGAVQAGAIVAQGELGELIDVSTFTVDQIDEKAAAIAHNVAVSQRAWQLARDEP